VTKTGKYNQQCGRLQWMASSQGRPGHEPFDRDDKAAAMDPEASTGRE